jgi:RsiW-degrading membrane proteinase PrsW (M82 family)
VGGSAAVLMLFGLIGFAVQKTGSLSTLEIVPANATVNTRIAGCASALLHLKAQSEGRKVPPEIAQNLTSLFGLSDEQNRLMQEFWNSLEAGVPTPELEMICGSIHPPPFASYLLARFFSDIGDWEKGFYYARREFELVPSRESKRLAVQFACRVGDRDWIRAEEQKPGFRKDLTATDQKNIARVTQDWKNIVWFMPQALFEQLTPATIVTVLISSAAWMVIFLQGARVRRANLVSAVLLLLAFFLGCLSVFAIDLIDYALFDLSHIPETGDLGYKIAFNVLCVGLPEEAVKLLFFAPLLPWLIRRNSESDVLFAAATIGLGFATIENFSFGQRGGPEIILTRFFLSTTVHFSATGIAGLALARAAANPRRYLGAFLSAFAFVFVMHGGFDALIAVPDLIPGFPLETVVVIFLALHFFRLVKMVRDDALDLFSLTATFLLGNSVIIGSIFLAATLNWSWIIAMKATSYTVVANLMLMFIFAKQLDET